MKDLPHHIKKLNRSVIRSMHREAVLEESLPEIPARPQSAKQKKKQAKLQVKKEKLSRPSSKPTPQERNKIMKGGRNGRVPIFDRTNNSTPKRTRPSKKKTPRI